MEGTRDDEEAAAEAPLLDHNSRSSRGSSRKSAIDVPLLDHNSRSSRDSSYKSENSNNDVRVEDTIPIEEEDHHHLPEPPLELYASYAKYCFRFARWLLVLVVVDISIVIITDMEFWVVLLNALFFFVAARAIDRDVAKVDGLTTSTTVANGEADDAVTTTTDWNNHEHIYGQVARRFDAWLASVSKTNPTATNHRQPSSVVGKTSFLTHLCWILWALFLASGYSETMNLAQEMIFPSPKNVTAAEGKSDSDAIENISEYPKDVQNWIKHESNKYTYSFPTASQSFRDAGFYDQLELPVLKDRMFRHHGNFLEEIIAFNNSLITEERKDVGILEIYIPLQSSIDGISATQYCFLSEWEELPECRGSHCFDRRDRLFCMDATTAEAGKPVVMKHVTLEWQTEKGNSDGREMASYKDMVFVAKIWGYSRTPFREVFRIDPTTMETTMVYRTPGTMDAERLPEWKDDDGYEDDPNEFSKFVHGLCGLWGASYYLIAKEGVISGVFPLVIGVFYVLGSLFSDTDAADGLFLVGVAFFKVLMCSDGSSQRRITKICPWFGKDAYAWALYAWISAVPIVDLLTFVPDPMMEMFYFEALPFVTLILTGIVLGHPILQLMGSFHLVGGIIELMEDYDELLSNPEQVLFSSFCGLAFIVIGNWFTRHRWIIYGRCRWCFLKLRYLRRRSHAGV